MDYVFLIEFNQQRANSGKLMENIKELGCKVHYITADPTGQGIFGIVEAPSLEQRDTFFRNIAYMVQKINNLPDDGPVYPTPTLGEKSYDGLATWAYSTVGEIINGLTRLKYDGKGSLLPYQIETILKGGVTGVHGG
ncbi:MAG: hypothetical protein AAF490_26755 [Chloroflexota bacterium]